VARSLRERDESSMTAKPLNAKRVLVFGGVAAGKSAYACDLARRSPHKVLAVATVAPGDARAQRNSLLHETAWETVAEPVELARLVTRESREGRLVLVDCLSQWMANLMKAGRDTDAAAQALSDAIWGSAGPVVLVSEEVGLSPAPEAPALRDLRERQGRINQRVARVCDTVVFMAAGTPMVMKPGPAVRL
jgi:adenosylcobinamide kinase/adenosylcobinamide-phosphate guanylyltransferase